MGHGVNRAKETTVSTGRTETTEKKFLNISVASVVLSGLSGKNRPRYHPSINLGLTAP
jgi:hypothetical protein